MARRSTFAVPTDPCLFSALQVQPAAVLRIGMTAIASCLSEQLVDWRLLQSEHHTAIVMVGARLEYLRDFDFFSASRIEVDAGLVARRGGRFLELDCRLSGPDGVFARLGVLNRPVRISSTETLDATPADLDETLLARLHPDEHDPAKVARPLVDRLAALESTGQLLDEGQLSFTVSRADCEHADQWMFVRLPEWLALGRERLVFAAADPRVKAGLRDPMTRMLAEYQRPMFLGDEGSLHTKAYADGTSLTFVHEVRAMTPGAGAQGLPCTVAIEEFTDGGWV